MAPAKSSRKEAADESSNKPDAGHAKEKAHNGKLRRVASATGSNLREVTNANASAKDASKAATSAAASAHSATAQGLQWPAFERDVLNTYRRTYCLDTPAAVAKDYHLWVLTQAGSLGLYSPTIARRRGARRQSVSALSSAVQKHFTSLGVQENDVIVDFLHKVRSSGVSKCTSSRARRAEQSTSRL